MTKLTNKHKLPATVVNAIKQVQSEYTGGKSDLSASGITVSPRIYWLTKRHKHEIKEDAADQIWSVIGGLVHLILEKAATFTDGARAEERLHKGVCGWRFSGQYDLVEGDTLYDYKITSYYSVMGEPKLEWICQANANRLLLHEHGTEINNLEIIAILRDWQKSKAKFDKNYPQTQIKRVKLPVWTLEETEKFLIDRVTLLQSHEHTPDDDLPPCTKEERWATDDVYAYYKDDKVKRATKLFDNAIDAHMHMRKNGGRVEKRDGEDRKCNDYCSVNKWCQMFLDKNEVDYGACKE
jgi:hypothetical protein